MSPILAVGILFVYFLLLVIISRLSSKGASTDSFFTANRQVPWYLVAFGMIGTSLSGVTFISVPGAVGTKEFSYFQMVLGYTLGYFFIANVLMPLYYRLNLISIYTYLEERFGYWSYKTGSAFFILSRTLGSAVRLFIAVQVLQIAIFTPLGVPFEVSVLITILLIWVYTYKGGVQTIIFTDTLQTAFLIISVVMTIVLIGRELGYNFAMMKEQINNSPLSQIFFFEGGWSDPKNFFKQFISGAFIAIVMTGLDQDLMQKNLTCRNIGDAKKNMLWFTIVMVIVNFMFLCLGALLYIYCAKKGINTPVKTDDLYPMLALEHFGAEGYGTGGLLVAITFLVGITAATYASSDSALTALTTAFCIDFLDFKNKEESQKLKIKNQVHVGFSVLFYIVIILFNALNNQDVISATFQIASYTYGPLLGLFGYGIYSKRKVIDKYVPYVCVASPFITFLLVQFIENVWKYKFGFENLLLNGAITALGLFIFQKKSS